MEKLRTVKGMVLTGVMILLVAALYFHASNKSFFQKDKEEEKLTAVQEVLLRDLEKTYPPSPKEVVKYYSSIIKCFYGEEYSEEEFQDLAGKTLALYDAELAANKSEEQYREDLKNAVDEFKKNKRVISSYTVSAASDVDYFSRDGYEWAKLYCVYSIREGSAYDSLQQAFLLRKDENGHWRIYGFKAADILQNGTGEG